MPRPELDLEKTYDIFVRPEGGHFVGLCAEVRSVVSGLTIEEIVEKTKALIARARHLSQTSISIAVRASTFKTEG